MKELDGMALAEDPILVACADGQLRVYAPADGAVVGAVAACEPPPSTVWDEDCERVRAVDGVPDGSLVVTGAGDGSVRLWERLPWEPEGA